MDQSFDFSTSKGRSHSRSPSLRPMLIVAGLALALGAGGMWAASNSNLLSGLFLVRTVDESGIATPAAEPVTADDISASPTPIVSPSEVVETVAEEARQAAEQVSQVVETQGGLDSRIAAMEQRLTRLDLQLQAAAGNAARAEALLIAFASRRAIERGAPLGYLADQLRLRFGEDRPNAVQTIIDAAQDPVTLDQLIAQLSGLAPQLDDAPAGEDVLTMLGRELSELFVVRREDTPSPMAERRLERARLFLESGRTEAAVSEVRNLPNAAIAESWIADAERYAAAQRALETLETAAVLDTRELRDGDGQAVEQRSPAGNERQ